MQAHRMAMAALLALLAAASMQAVSAASDTWPYINAECTAVASQSPYALALESATFANGTARLCFATVLGPAVDDNGQLPDDAKQCTERLYNNLFDINLGIQPSCGPGISNVTINGANWTSWYVNYPSDSNPDGLAVFGTGRLRLPFADAVNLLICFNVEQPCDKIPTLVNSTSSRMFTSFVESGYKRCCPTGRVSVGLSTLPPASNGTSPSPSNSSSPSSNSTEPEPSDNSPPAGTPPTRSPSGGIGSGDSPSDTPYPSPVHSPSSPPPYPPPPAPSPPAPINPFLTRSFTTILDADYSQVSSPTTLAQFKTDYAAAVARALARQPEQVLIVNIRPGSIVVETVVFVDQVEDLGLMALLLNIMQTS